ncbi:hypothetical protein GcM3_170012 [Golovinomyces cichoracearum]|uniref:Uncharacterized protein n=1 Tax=Golovinomyces cichoracearum TaxID=62708 RepID=A0A420HR52_9PEZI|nr:hypothetical protein GcM3_170012 [Golovinomyces cichoracearum]
MSDNLECHGGIIPSPEIDHTGRALDASSDNDSYAGVEQISDSEENEPDLEKVEECAIISSENREMDLGVRSAREEIWEGFSDIPSTIEDMTLFGQENISEDEWFLQSEVIRDERPNKCVTDYRAHSVHLESSDDEFEMFDDVFPDIFIDKDHLDSSFRRQIDHDEVSDDGSYWEHDEVENMYGNNYPNAEVVLDMVENGKYDDYDSDCSSLTGYETDISGETTDDDLPAEYYLQNRGTTARLSPNDSETERGTQASSPVCAPRLYSWKHTSDKPFATVSSNCKKMIVFNVKDFRQSNFTKMTQQTSFNQATDQVRSSPLNQNTTNFIISTMPNPILTEINNLAYSGLPDTTECMNQTGTGTGLYDSSGHDSDDEQEDNCAETTPNLDEFINFEPDDCSTFDAHIVEPSSDCVDAAPDISACATRIKEETQVHPLISHFNRGVVGSWRQKQNTHKLLHRNIVSQDSLSFGGNRFIEGTLKGVKNGRLKHANTPITPARKQRTISLMTRAKESLSMPAKSKERPETTGEGVRNFKRRKYNI